MLTTLQVITHTHTHTHSPTHTHTHTHTHTPHAHIHAHSHIHTHTPHTHTHSHTHTHTHTHTPHSHIHTHTHPTHTLTHTHTPHTHSHIHTHPPPHTHTHTHTHTQNSYKYYSLPNVQNIVHVPGTHYGDADGMYGNVAGRFGAVLFKPDCPFTKQTVASPTEWGEHYERPYSRITSTKSPSFSKTTFTATLTYLMVLLPKWHDCSYQVSGRILAPPPIWPQKHADACFLDLWHQPRLTAEAGEFTELILLYLWRTQYETFHRLITLCIA